MIKFNNRKNKKVAVYAGTKNLYYKMLIAATSLIENCPSIDKIYFLIQDEEFPYSLPPIIKTINVVNQSYIKQSSPNINTYYTYMAMMRVCLFDILPNESKVLSLDVDTIVMKDISELWSIDLKDNYCAMVREPDRCEGGRYQKPMDPPLYYNAGVTMFNLDQIRKDNAAARLIEKLNTQKLEFIEQDCINQEWQGRIYQLDSIYNCTNPYARQINGYYITEYCRDEDAKIIHYAVIKDWEKYPQVQKYEKNMIGKNK